MSVYIYVHQNIYMGMHTNIPLFHLTIHLIGNMKVCINVPMITTWILCRVTSLVIIDFGQARSNKLQDRKIFLDP